jgi:hypothetical protein
MSELTPQQILIDTAFGNYEIECFVTKRGKEIEVIHNKTKNQFVQVTPGSGSHCEIITATDAKSLLDDGHKLLWKHIKDVGTTYYDPASGEVKFWPYTGKV